MRAKVLDQDNMQHLIVLMWSHFKRVNKRRRGPAESLTLFSNDWFNLLVCVDLFTNLTYLLYWINVCRNVSHYKLKAAGMSKTMRHTTPHGILDRINYNSITEMCEIKFHHFFPQAWKFRFQNVMAFSGFPCTNPNKSNWCTLLII